MMGLPEFDRIIIDQVSANSEVAARVQTLYPKDIIEFSDGDPFLQKKGKLSAEQYNTSKRTLFLTEFKGLFFKRCPGATQKKALTCCNYHVLNLGSQCNMNCSYCYLQSYLNSQATRIYTNIDQALQELESMAREHPEQPFRVGTGEIVDSLSLDELTLYSRKLISFFQKYPNWILELKTKSNKVDQFLDLPGSGNIVISWSINAPYIIKREEHGTANFNERLAAARKCADRGYRVAFHIDPMIWHPQWKENYAFVAEEITKNFSEKEVHTLSMGTLRFQPEQKQMMKERFGMSSLVNQAEMFPSENGKMRYDAGLRAEMFQHMQNVFRSLGAKFSIMLCMETPETWISAFDKIPSQMPELRSLFRPLPQVREFNSNSEVPS